MTQPSFRRHRRAACSCGFLSPAITERLRQSEDPRLREIAFQTQHAQVAARTAREAKERGIQGRVPVPGYSCGRFVYDMAGKWQKLPGTLVRKEGAPACGDPDADQAYDHAGIVHQFYRSILSRDSIDGAGLPIRMSVHHGVGNYEALWNGQQVAFGDGDGRFFLSPTGALDVVGHEFTHGVVGECMGLEYYGEPGALNESFCDVMGALVAHYHAGHEVDQANWLIGGAMASGELGIAGFRSFTEAPAFVDNAVIGTDPQVKHMRDYVTTDDDAGGVHINSGIPNHAFYLVARTLGGKAWETAGRIWYDAMTNQRLGAQASFSDAAAATFRAAVKRDGGVPGAEAGAVAAAWAKVGVTFEV